MIRFIFMSHHSFAFITRTHLYYTTFEFSKPQKCPLDILAKTGTISGIASLSCPSSCQALFSRNRVKVLHVSTSSQRDIMGYTHTYLFIVSLFEKGKFLWISWPKAPHRAFGLDFLGGNKWHHKYIFSLRKRMEQQCPIRLSFYCEVILCFTE